MTRLFYKNFVWAVGLTALFYSSSFAADGEWSEYKKTHFIIYYRNAPKDFVQTVEREAERYYAQIARNLGFTRYSGWTWDDRAKIYIYDDANHYVTGAGQAGWSHGVASPHNKEIHTYPAAHGFFDSVLPHELGHIIFREFVGFKADVPAWFEEGIAMYQEQAQRWGAHDEVRKALRNETFLPLNSLTLTRLHSNSSKDKVDLFYSESASIVNYLITEFGQQRFVQLCRKLQDGRPFEWALDSVYVRFKTVEDLNNAWLEYLQK